MTSSVAAGQPQARLISTSASTAKSAALPQDSVVIGGSAKDDSIDSSANGWVGNNSLFIRLNQHGSHVAVSGNMGQGFVNLSEDINGADASIFGTISTPRGFINVDVQVSSDGNGGKNYSGWLGDGDVSISEDKNGTIFGDLGQRNLSINRNNSGNNADFNGSVSGFGDNGFVNVGVQSSKPNAALDALVPLFGIIR